MKMMNRLRFRGNLFLPGLCLVGAVALPKCVICLFGYLALSGALAGSGPELCGTTTEPKAAIITWVAGALVGGLALLTPFCRRRRSGIERPDRPADGPQELMNCKLPNGWRCEAGEGK